MRLPLFPVTTVGSWPRPKAVLKAQRAKQAGEASSADFSRIADAAVADFISLQTKLGVEIVTDGELRRDNFYSFVSEKLDGVRLMSLGEMLDYVEDKEGFEELLQRLDVPSYAIKNPTCIAKISRREPLAVGDLKFAKSITDKPVKVTLPGPYLLTRAMWVPEVSGGAYRTKEELAEAVVDILSAEVRELASSGAAFIQFDEPVLTELVFTQGKTRTFMCAALAARNDPAEELEFAVSLINRVVAAASGVRTGVHVCRGNWSRREETLLAGSYRPLEPYLKRLNVNQLVLEYATPRAGDLVGIEGKEIGLGVVNPRTDEIESQEEIVRSVDAALLHWQAERIFLNPDCGFATFSERQMNAAEVAEKKLASICAAAQILRSRKSQSSDPSRRRRDPPAS